MSKRLALIIAEQEYLKEVRRQRTEDKQNTLYLLNIQKPINHEQEQSDTKQS